MKIIIGDKEYCVTSKYHSSAFRVNDEEVIIDMYSPRKNFLHILYSNKSYKAELVAYNQEDKTLILKINNCRYELNIKDETDELLEKLGIKTNAKKVANIKAPMPGLVLDIRVKEGDEVNKGDALIVLEAMKMENLIKAELPGKVKKVLVSKGAAVEKNQALIEMS